MKVYHLTIAAAAAGLLVAATSPASATPLSPASPLAIDRFDGEIEPVHYRPRAARRYHRAYRSGPVVTFGYAPYAYASPYYVRPYGYSPYGYGYGGYPYGYGYGYAPSIGFGFHLR